MWYVTDIKGLCLYSGVACLPVDGAPSCLTTATMGGQAQALILLSSVTPITYKLYLSGWFAEYELVLESAVI